MTRSADHAPKSHSATVLIVALLMLLVTVVVYNPARRLGFVDYDDPMYVTENDWVLAGITPASLAAAWTEPVAGNWHPITMLSHLLDVELYGLDAEGHHLTSLWLHGLNAALLFLLLHSLCGGVAAAALAAGLFALHPFNVDSAVWIAERKNLLSTAFWILATLAYLAHVRRPSLARLLGAAALFQFGLMSKPMLVTFPFALLLLDFWPLRRVAGWRREDFAMWRNLLAEKSAFFLLAAISCVITLQTQFAPDVDQGGLVAPLWARACFALQNYVEYLGKFFWPAGLCVLYPRQSMPPGLWSCLGAGLILVFLTAVVWRLARRAPAWMVGWCWFLGTLFPLIGLVAIGHHRIADRYMYVPMIGLIMALVWGAMAWPLNTSSRRRLGAALLLAALAASAWQTRRLLPHWRDSETLFRRALTVTEGNYVMHYNLGRQRMERNDPDAAIAEFEIAIRMAPDYGVAHNNLGWAKLVKGQVHESVPHFEAALRLDARNNRARLNLASACLSLGRYPDALHHFEEALARQPESQEARTGVAEARKKMGLPPVWRL